MRKSDDPGGVTGWGQHEDKVRSREAGFDAHLVKPIDFSVLEELLANSTNGKSDEAEPRKKNRWSQNGNRT